MSILRFPPRLVSLIVAIAFAVPALAGCAQLVQESEAATADGVSAAIWHERMRTFLQAEYARGDAVEDASLGFADVEALLVGDIPVVHVTATINSEGKDVHAYFRAKDASFVTEGRAPTYFEAAQSKLSYRLTQAMSQDAGLHDLTVSYIAPEGYVIADDVSDPYTIDDVTARNLGGRVKELAEIARERALTDAETASYVDSLAPAQGAWNTALVMAYLGAEVARLRELPGVTDARGSGNSIPFAFVRADAAGIAAIAADPSVLAIDLDVMEPLSTLLDKSRVVNGVKASNDASHQGNLRKVAVFDSGMNNVLVSGNNCLPRIDNRNFAGESDTSDRDPVGHGTSMGYIVRGSRSDGVTECPPQPRGLAKSSSLYNARIMDVAGLSSTSIVLSAWEYAATTWNAHVGSNSWTAGGGGDNGNNAYSTRLDYVSYTYNKVHTAACGDTARYGNVIVAPAGAYNSVTACHYNDRNTEANSADDILGTTAPTVRTPDSRAKPDASEPGENINSPDKFGIFADRSGSSAAARLMRPGAWLF